MHFCAVATDLVLDGKSCHAVRTTLPHFAMLAQVTLTPLATFEAHFSEANALSGALSHLLSEHLLSANVVDLSQLCIASGKHCWSLSLDIYVLNNDGCLLDACLAAGVAALADLKVCSSHLHSATSGASVAVLLRLLMCMSPVALHE